MKIRWMQPPTLEEYDAEDQARREDEAIALPPDACEDCDADKHCGDCWCCFDKTDLTDWTPSSLKHVDRHIEGDVDWP